MPGPGTKVSDPHSEITEKPGPVANDALAADSTRAGGKFSENPDSEPLGVKGSNSTFANTNTSGARTLDSTTDAASRDSEEASFTGREQSSTKKEGFSQATSSNAGVAPGYVHQPTGGKPKGKNLTEGGFEDYSGKNASFNQDIGGKNDPGRLAEAGFQKSNSKAVGGIPTQKGDIGENVYDALNRDSSA